MKRVLYSSPYVPEEWVSAHGHEPVRLSHVQDASMVTEGRCMFATEFLTRAECPDVDLIIAATTCDQMRHIPEVVESETPVFLMNVPSTWQTSGSFKLYIAELKRLSDFLCIHGGITPDSVNLEAAMNAAEARRMGVAGEGRGAPIAHAIPVGVTGGPLLYNSTNLIAEIEAAGGTVILDATESGEMTVPGKFDRRRLKETPFEVLAETYFAIPDIGRRPNSHYYNYLQSELGTREVRGLIIQRYTWCDLWHAEVQRIKEWASIPVLDLGGDHAQDARAATKIQAFMEMLRD